MSIPFAILYIIVAYFIGNIDFGYIIPKYVKGDDIRKRGSGNPGTANVLRNYGKGLAIAVFAGDFLKGLLVVLAARWLGLGGWWFVAAALAVVVGHNWPILLKFKGGKGVATTIGVLSGVDFAVGIYPLTLGLIIAYVTKIISIGSIVGVCSFPVFVLIYKGTSNLYELVLGLILAVLNLWRHRENIVRLIRKEENKVVSNKEEG